MSKPNLRDLHWVIGPGLYSFLGALGGWSFKWTRRYLAPAIGGIVAWLYGFSPLRSSLYAIATAIAFSMGYSPEKHSLFYIASVGGAYGLTPFILEFRPSRLWWPILTGATLSGLMCISLNFNWFTWKWAELIVFGLHGFLWAWTIDKKKK